MKMRMAKSRRGLLLAALVALAGCGTAEYEARLNHSLVRIGQAARFNDLRPAAPLGPFSIRIPRAYLAVPTEGVSDLDALRRRPPAPKLAADAAAYEAAIVDSGRGKLPCSLFVSVEPVASRAEAIARPAPTAAIADGRKLEASGEVAQSVKAVFPAAGGWEDVECPTPTGGTIGWQRLKASGPQDFRYLDFDNQPSRRKLDGRLEVYARVHSGQLLLLVWSYPALVERHADVGRLGELVAGSIERTAP